MRRDVIDCLKARYREKRPLNISAINEDEPWLIDAIYDRKNFIGYRNTLKLAGIDYRYIKIYLKDYVQCECCGEYFRTLGSHVSQIHQCDLEDYRIDYPDSPLMCEELRANLFIRSRYYRDLGKSYPHWEPLWTKEYALDRLYYFYELGYFMNHANIAILDVYVCVRAAQYFGGYDNALLKIGLNPDEVRPNRKNVYPDKESVIREITRRYKEGIGLSISEVTATLEQGGDNFLVKRAKKFYGSWRSAIEAADFKSSDFINKPKRIKYPTKKSIVEEIRRRKENGETLIASKISKGKSCDPSLWRNSKRLFGSWGKALKASGINAKAMYEQSNTKVRFKSKDEIIQEINNRNKKGLPLDPKTLVDLTKKDGGDSSLYLKGKAFFDGWKNALKAANLDPEAISPPGLVSIYPDKQAVAEGIKRHARAVADDEKPHDMALYHQAAKHYGSWKTALRAVLGQDNLIRKKKARLYPDKNSIILEIKKRNRANQPIAGRALSAPIVKGGDKSLYSRGQEYFGSWNLALEAAGIRI